MLLLSVSFLFFFIGTGLFSYYQARPAELEKVKDFVVEQKLLPTKLSPQDPDYAALRERIKSGLKPGEVGDKVFPHFIGARLPSGLRGLLIAALFAAAMSTLSTSLNSSATLIMRDLYQRYLKPHAQERDSLRVLHLATVGLGLACAGGALLLVRLTESALDIWWTLSGIFGGGMLGLFLLGMVSRRTGSAAAAGGVVVGILAIGWMTLSPRWGAEFKSPFHSFLIPVFGSAIIMLSGWLLGLILSGRRKSEE
jgi:SSS family solute:Na+ symporter